MGKMTKIALLLGALALPAYADPPAAGASAGSDSTAAPSLGARADDGSSQLGAKAGVHAHATAGADTHAANATGDTGAKDYRVDVDATASDKDAKDSKAAAKASSHRVKAKAKRGKAGVKASAVAKPNAGTEHAVNGGINPTPGAHQPGASATGHENVGATATGDEQVGVGASVTGDDKARASSAAGANAGVRDTGAKAGINANAGDRDTGAKAGIHANKGVDSGASAGTGAGAGAEIDDTGAGSNRRP
jgi:hypothetical protein